jgi:hypothetical protein
VLLLPLQTTQLQYLPLLLAVVAAAVLAEVADLLC